MAKHTAAQIYAFARAAGFDPDQAVTMTAIALAESGGRSGAHNTMNENSVGLWQINLRANADRTTDLDLFSPRDNATAAFRVSEGGRDISPWTTTHGGNRAKYLQFREQAQAAAVAHGDPPGLGMWQGTSGYQDHQSAGRFPSDPGAGTGTGTASGSTTSAVQSPSDPAGSPLTTHGLALAQPDPGTGPSEGPPIELAAASTGPPIEVAGATTEPPVEVAGATAGALVEPAGTSPAVSSAPEHGLALAAPDTAGPPAPGVESGVPLPMPVGARFPGSSAGFVSGDGPSAPTSRADRFVAAALDQQGDSYVFGAQVRLGDRNPSAFDCSELVRWAAHQAGTEMPDGSWLQFLHLRQKGLVVPVEEGIHTKGALLFSFSSPPTAGGARPSHSHVAISLGDERTIEARGRAYGVDSFDASTKRFQYAAVLPGMTQDAPSAPAGAALPETGPVATGGGLLDTDGDGLVNRLEQRLGLDPFDDDTDGDRFSDSYELLFGGTEPLVADLGGAWNPQMDDALLAGASALTGTGDPAAAPAGPAGRHGLALAQPDGQPDGRADGRADDQGDLFDDGSGADAGGEGGPELGEWDVDADQVDGV